MEVQNGVQAVLPTPDNQVQAEQPTYAIQETQGGRKLVRVEATVESKQEPAEQPKETEVETKPIEAVETEVEKEPQELQPYTAEELADAEDITKLDESRVPDALKPIYKNMIRGMNRKFQEMAAERKALKEMADALKKPEPVSQPNPKDMYLQRHNFIKQKVEAYFGEEFNPVVFPEHQLAYNDIEFQLKSAEQQKQVEQEKVQTQEQRVAAIVDELKSQPDWEKVLNFAHENLPAKEWEAGDALLRSGDKDKVMAKYKEWRDKCYNVTKPTAPKPEKPKPPVLETGGQGDKTPVQTVSLNGEFLGKFRNASQQEKVKMIAQWRKSQGG